MCKDSSKQLRIAVIHWFPLEYYPPATNVLNYFGCQAETETYAFSSENPRGRVSYANPNVSVIRQYFPDSDCGRLVRLWRYIIFPIAVVWRLIRLRPDCVFYYEPQSSFPALIYAAINRRCRILVHHHEYHDPGQFMRPGMRLVRFYHWLEKRFLFKRAVWISHTNDRRLALFHADHPSIDLAKLRVMGNYPPASWGDRLKVDGCREQTIREGNRGLPRNEVGVKSLRLVYVGSVSLHDTFIGPLVEWIHSRDDDTVTLDVYAYNADEKTKKFLREAMIGGGRPEAGDRREKSAGRIRYFEEGVDYYGLPDVLSNYDIGLILYRCNTTNYKFNASNKLFEYLACGLEVWYPPQMLGVKPYSRDDAFPRVMEADFERLDAVDLEKMMTTQGIPSAPPPPCCEDEFEKLLVAMRSG